MASNTTESTQKSPTDLTTIPFLVDLARTFKVSSIPLAIFLLILCILASILLLIILIDIAKRCLRSKYKASTKKQRAYPAVFLDQISGYEGLVGELGCLEYSLYYDVDRKELAVIVIQAYDLFLRPDRETIDAYVQTTLYKEKQEKLIPIGPKKKTNHRPKNRPVWNEDYDFKIEEKDLNAVTIIFEVYDYEAHSQDVGLGRLVVRLRDMEVTDYIGQIFEKTEKLELGDPPLLGVGEMCLGLCFIPSTHCRIELTVQEACGLNIDDNLPHAKKNRIFLEAELRDQEKQRVGRKRTKYKDDAVNPYFNEVLSFHLEKESIAHHNILCRLRCRDRLLRKRTLGHIVLGSISPLSTGVKHWELVLRRPGKLQYMWHVVLPELPSYLASWHKR